MLPPVFCKLEFKVIETLGVTRQQLLTIREMEVDENGSVGLCEVEASPSSTKVSESVHHGPVMCFEVSS